MKIELLSQDLLISVLSFVDLPEILRFPLLSKSFYLKFKNPAFIECLMMQLRGLRLFNFKPPKEDILSFFKSVYKRLSQIQQKPSQILSWLPLDASSTDKNQSIYCTIPEFNGFWGSTGFTSENENQWLLYDFGENFTQCFLKEITITFTHFNYVYVNGQTVGNPVFQSKFVQVELGFVPDRPIYKSEVIPVLQTISQGEELTVTVPIFPFIVFARYARIVFIGISNKHTLKDNLFYLCVDKIIPKGNYCYYIPEIIINNALANFYSKVTFDAKRENEMENKDFLYIKDEKEYISAIIENINKLQREGKIQNIPEIFEVNPQLKTRKTFLKLLIENTALADLYLETLRKKQMHLNLNETIVMLSLSMDWKNVDIFGDKSFLKNDKYLSMFWIFYFVPQKLQKYIDDYYEVDEDEAFRNLEEDTVGDVSQLELHGALELKKLVLEKALQQLRK